MFASREGKNLLLLGKILITMRRPQFCKDIEKNVVEVTNLDKMAENIMDVCVLLTKLRKTDFTN